MSFCEANAGKLPVLVRVEDIAVARPDMPARCGTTSAPSAQTGWSMNAACRQQIHEFALSRRSDEPRPVRLALEVTQVESESIFDIA